MLDLTVDETALFDVVRRFTEHDDTRGGYRPVIIGWWDRLGYTHCLDCPPDNLEQDERGYPDPIPCDNCAVEGESCDFCSVSLLKAALERFGRQQSRI